MQISVNKVTKAFGSGPDAVQALDEVGLEVGDNEFVSIVGPSGCGKSTLLDIVGGLQTATSGTVEIDGVPVTEPHPSLGYIFQQDSTFPWRTVRENVEFGLEMRGVGRRERRERALRLTKLVGLSGFEDRYPAQLSGGMRQRVALARTLALDPQVLLMDEPFGALDQQTRLILGEELLRIWAQTGASVMFVTHSIEEAVLLSDRVIAMTARPGEIKLTMPVDLGRPRDSTVVSTPRFGELTGKIWEAIRVESLRTLEREG